MRSTKSRAKFFNGMIDRRPAIIARCEGVGDVKRAIRFGRDAGLLVAVRGGGHGVTGHGACDGGLADEKRPRTEVGARPIVRWDWGGWIRTTDLLINSKAQE